MNGKDLVAAVQEAMRKHGTAWAAMVPDAYGVNNQAEQAEEDAYAELAHLRTVLCDHVYDTYGVSVSELSRLAMY